jgi:hypothetical protein
MCRNAIVWERSGVAKSATNIAHLTVKPITANGPPRGATVTPAAPLTSAGWAKGASREKVSGTPTRDSSRLEERERSMFSTPALRPL